MKSRVIADDIHHRRRGLHGVVQIGEAVREAGTEVQQGRRRRLLHARIAVGSAGRHALEQREHARIPSTRSSAATKCISDVPGLEKQTFTPPPTSVRTKLSAPFIRTLAQFECHASQSGRITPLTPADAPSTSSAISMRAGSTGPVIVIAPFGARLKPTRA